MDLAHLQQTNSRSAISPLVVNAWLYTILASALPDILALQFQGSVPPWLFPVKILVMCLLFLLTWVWKSSKPLRYYFILLLINVVAWWSLPNIRSLAVWSSWEGHVSWGVGMLGIQLLKFCISLGTLAILGILFKRRSVFYLVKGNLGAMAEPVRWLGIGQLTSWKSLAPIIALAASSSMLLILILGNPTSLTIAVKAWPLLPIVLLLSITNAFNEEVSYRASLLAPLEPVLGKGQTLGMTAVFFGLAHASGGVPLATIQTALMTGFLGWLIARSMLETRGFTWAWFIHFFSDIPVFVFLAIGSVS